MATIRDVAKAAGVSTATVSAVMNDSAYVSPELRSRVQTAIEELDYAPSTVARNLKRGKSQLIAVSVADLANPFFSHIVCLAEAAAAAASARQTMWLKNGLERSATEMAMSWLLPRFKFRATMEGA